MVHPAAHRLLGNQDPTLTTVKSSQPRLLDLGAGTGRIGWPFVEAGDDYAGADLSLGMLQEFMRRAGQSTDHTPRLLQADGQRLPFRDAIFDVVMLIQIFGITRGWQHILTEARRVLRPQGALVVGWPVAPADGVDVQLKQRLASLLREMGVEPRQKISRDDVQRWLESDARSSARVIAAAWTAERTPRQFLDRQRTGAWFSALPELVKEEALRKLSGWATTKFDSLDAVFSEPYAFELRVFKFQEGASCRNAGENG